MPKDTSHVLPPKLVTDPNAARREPTLRRRLPQAVFDRLQHGRDTGHPYRYTHKDVEAIVHYTSHTDKVFDPRVHRWPTQQQYDQQRAAARSFSDRIGEERKKSLADRIERPPLIERLAPPTAEFARPKPILSDFAKFTPAELEKIFSPCITATRRRLQPVLELLDNARSPAHQKTVRELIDKFEEINYIPTVTVDQWRSLELGLKAIGQIEFKGLRQNFDEIVKRLAGVYTGGYFDWIRK